MSSKKIDDVIMGDKVVYRADGFARLDRYTCHNVYEGGELSEPYTCDSVHKGGGNSNLVVAMILHCMIDGVPHFVLRKQARPLLTLMGEHPCPWGLPVGCVEVEDESLVKRAIAEIEEEVGITLAGQIPEELGKPMWTSPGWVVEKVHFYEMLLNGPQAVLLKNGNVSQAQGESMEAGGEARLFSHTKAMRNVKSLMAELAIRRVTEKYYADLPCFGS